MTLYFFHLRDGADDLLDLDGQYMSSVAAAKASALKAARDILCHDVREGCIDIRYRIDVEDQSGTIVHSLPLRDAFKIIGPG